MLLAYAMLGTRDVERSRAFWDPVMAALGAEVNPAYSNESRTWYARGELGLLAIGLPHDGKPASCGNGTMVALMARDREMVHAAHAEALAHGGTDEGAPGDRSGGWYGGYFRDPDGNKAAVFILER